MATATAAQQAAATTTTKEHVITSRVHARIGLLGNPSDGYNGKTISFALANFYAEVLAAGWLMGRKRCTCASPAAVHTN